MKVSVVTISYNQARFLDRAIRSVLAQSHDDIEYIVVDAGSRDGSRDIIEGHREHIARVILEPDDGPADGLNKGFAAANGEVLAYLNADDAFLPGAVAAAAAEFDRHPDTDIVVGHGYIIDAHGKVVRRFRSAPYSRWRFALGAAVVVQQSTFFRADAFHGVGGFNPANPASWDAELYLEMCLAGARVRVADGYWSLFTVHAESISGSGRREVEHAATQRRLFRRAMGREMRQSDRMLFPLARACRWQVDPRGLSERLKDWYSPAALPADWPPSASVLPTPSDGRGTCT